MRRQIERREKKKETGSQTAALTIATKSESREKTVLRIRGSCSEICEEVYLDEEREEGEKGKERKEGRERREMGSAPTLPHSGEELEKKAAKEPTSSQHQRRPGSTTLSGSQAWGC